VLISDVFGLKITALDIAFVSAVLGGLVGVLVPVTTWLVSKSQRQQDKFALIYKDKVVAYQAAASDAYRGRELVADYAEKLAKIGVGDAEAKTLIDQLDADLDEVNDEEPATLASLAIVAPESVMTARAEFAEAWNEAVTELLYEADREAKGFATKALKLTEAAEPILVPAIQKLRRAMRDDLTP
jgi:hypothetical protein